MTVPPKAPMPIIGAYALVMIASGMLSSSPNTRPTTQLGHGKRAAPMANPIPNRAMKAAVIAALLSGKLIGIMIPTSITPNAKPRITPSRILDICLPTRLLTTRAVPVNQLIRLVST